MMCLHPRTAAGREECDHTHAMVALINDKTDGFLDSLLPYAYIEINETRAGCNDPNSTLAGLHALRDWDDQLLAAIGPQCSGDVKAVSSAAVRAELGHNTVFISDQSTAPALSNSTAYPHVIRMSSPETLVMAALCGFIQQQGWRRVALLHDDTVWGVESGQAFRADFNGEVLTTDDDGHTGAILGHSICKVEEKHASKEAAASEWLDRLERVHARIIVLAVQPVGWPYAPLKRATRVGSHDAHSPVAQECMRYLFSTAYRQNRTMVGQGFAWLTNWMTEDFMRMADGVTNDLDAIRGAEGLIGVQERLSPTLRRSPTSVCELLPA